tara:strand:+ start:17256 stop:18128 length:873 start_codon:yes stop_codon:yes gene_type:complete
MYRPRLRSRHPSHEILRPRNKNLPLFPCKSVIRLGSTTDLQDTVTNGGNRIEINTIEAIKNSSNKRWMKELFTQDGIKTAEWWSLYTLPENDIVNHEYQLYREENEENVILRLHELPYPIISKNIYGSRGRGNIKHDNKESLEAWMEGKDLDNYIFEKYYNYVREYRIHVTENGYFYACRKMLKNGTDNKDRWYRNNDHCVWIVEENPLFDKPNNWDKLIEECVKSLKSIKLDIGAIDLKIQSNRNKDGSINNDPKFIIIEINSAPSFGNITEIKYIEEITKLLNKKCNE